MAETIDSPPNDGASKPMHNRPPPQHRGESQSGFLHSLAAAVQFSDPSDGGGASAPLLHRVRASVAENGPLICEASKDLGRRVLIWTRQGSPLRALLVISVGTIILLTLTGLFIFMLFFLAATFNVIIISLLMSVAAAGGFFALFFSCMTMIYIGALFIAAFAISTATFVAIVCALVATGWIGFFWTLWLLTRSCLGLAKHSLSRTGSALSVFSPPWHDNAHNGLEKVAG